MQSLEPHPLAVPMSRLQTFLVEDSPLIRENLIATLEELAPVDVVGSADNEGAATDWLTAHRGGCDLVIVDIFLKSGSGLGVLGSFAACPSASKLVVLSNYATADIRRKCLELGADRVFDKSSEIDSLVTYCVCLAHRGNLFGGRPA